MAYISSLFKKNFIEYASYVIKDRAIPDLDDGLKPVQRRILHSLHEMDDGKFNKVANVVGHCMKYHPHGDASIFAALVNMANKDLFVDKQGNFGNIFTGDPASAARYIECRLLPLARDVLFNPAITEYNDSYDGRNREPIVFPAKIPVVLIQGVEGIAVGMSTHILPHNLIEVLQAVKNGLEGKYTALYPDFPTGGYVDVSEYNDGNGKVLVRAVLDTSDPKRIVVRELPYGMTTESLIASIESAAKQNKIKISTIVDYSTDQVEVEINLPRGVHTQDVVDGLYAFTACELSISLNLLVIKNNQPVVLSVSDVIKHHTQRLLDILKAELKLEERDLLDRLHARTLEQIFIQERIYKSIEKMKTAETVIKAVIDGFVPFSSQIKREVTKEDVELLLKIPIRRISLYDINRAQKEIEEILARLKQVRHHLGHLTDYAIGFIDGIVEKFGEQYSRKTTITSFSKVDVREAAQRNLKLRYDRGTGYLGYDVNGNSLFDVSAYDRILVIRKSGLYSVFNAPDKLFVDKGMWHCVIMDEEAKQNLIYTLVYREDATGFPFIKRCRIDQFILNKGYSIVPDKCTILGFTTETEATIRLEYKPKLRLKILTESFLLKDYLVKGVKAGGVRLANKEIKSVQILIE